jgi:hypothetical protein
MFASFVIIVICFISYNISTFLTFVGLNDDQMHSSNDYICSDYDYTECLSLLTDNPITNLFFCVASRMLPLLLSTGTELICFCILIWEYCFSVLSNSLNEIPVFCFGEMCILNYVSTTGICYLYFALHIR